MVFSSITFIFTFLPVVLLVYFCCPLKGKNWVLAISGLVFYAWGEPSYIVLMIFSTLVDYTAGRVMDRWAENPLVRRVTLICFGSHQPVPAGSVQVQLLPHREPERPFRAFHPGPGAAAAHRDLLLHVPEHVLYH